MTATERATERANRESTEQAELNESTKQAELNETKRQSTGTGGKQQAYTLHRKGRTKQAEAQSQASTGNMRNVEHAKDSEHAQHTKLSTLNMT